MRRLFAPLVGVSQKIRSKVNNIKYKVLNNQIEHNFTISETDKPHDLEEIYRLRYDVYCNECNYLPSDNYPDKREIDRYDNHSVHFKVIEKVNNNIIGTVRLVSSDPSGLPIEHDFGLGPENGFLTRENTLEISRLVVKKNYRKIKNHGALLGILKAIFHYCNQNNYRYLVAAIDKNVFNMLKRFGFSFEILAPSKFYMGSESVPVRINLDNESMWLKIVNPGFWYFLNSKNGKT